MNVKRAFKKNNITNPLYVASNGLEALAKLRGYADQAIPPRRQLISRDLNTPQQGGIEFLRELRSDLALGLTPAIVSITSNEDSNKVQAYNLSVASYSVQPVTISKPVNAVMALTQYWTLSELP